MPHILSFLVPALFALPSVMTGKLFVSSTFYIFAIVILYMCFGYIFTLSGIGDVWYLLGRFQIVIAADIIGYIICKVHQFVFTGRKQMFFYPFMKKDKTYSGGVYNAIAWMYCVFFVVIVIIYECTKFTGFMEIVAFALLLLLSFSVIIWLFSWTPTPKENETNSRKMKIKNGFLGLALIQLLMLVVIGLSQFWVFVPTLLGPSGETFWVQNIALVTVFVFVGISVIIFSILTKKRDYDKKNESNYEQ